MNDKKYLINSNQQYVIIAENQDELHAIIDILLTYLPEECFHPEIFDREDTPVCISINTSKHYLVNYNSNLDYYAQKFSGINIFRYGTGVRPETIFRPKSETQQVVVSKKKVNPAQHYSDASDSMIKALGTAEKILTRKEPYKYNKPMELISSLIDDNVELLNYEEEPTITPTIVEEPTMVINAASLLCTMDISYVYDSGTLMDSGVVTITLKLSEDTIEHMKETKKSKSRKFCIEYVMCSEYYGDNNAYINKSCFFISNTRSEKKDCYVFEYNKDNDNYTLSIGLYSLAIRLSLIEALVGIHTLTKNKFNNSVLTSSDKPFKINLTVNNNPDHKYKLYTLTEVGTANDDQEYFGYYNRYAGGSVSYPNTLLNTSRSHYKPNPGSVSLMSEISPDMGISDVIYRGARDNSTAKNAIRRKYMDGRIEATDADNIRVHFVNTEKFFKAFMSNIFVNGIGYIFNNRLNMLQTIGTMSLGSFISDICSDTSGVETFINTIKAEKLKDMFEIKCTTDEGSPKISQLYNDKYHVTHTKGDLHNSCMRHDSCTKRLQLYDYLQEAGVLRMMYYKQITSEKIFGRCLVWSFEGNEYYDRFYSAASFIRTKHMDNKNKLHGNFYYKKGTSHPVHFNIVVTDEAVYDKIHALLSSNIRDYLSRNSSYSMEVKSTSQDVPYMDTAQSIIFTNEPKTITIRF